MTVNLLFDRNRSIPGSESRAKRCGEALGELVRLDDGYLRRVAGSLVDGVEPE